MLDWRQERSLWRWSKEMLVNCEWVWHLDLFLLKFVADGKGRDLFLIMKVVFFLICS